jgi:glucosyl-3-phosphoglycerate phosphatase
LAKTVTLIRHAETNANRAGRWQGSADSGISAHGESQLLALMGRNNGSRPAVLVASDLPRTMRTARVLGDPVATPAWREFGVGAWEGLTSAEITERHPGEMEAFLRGEEVAPGGGENMADFRTRVVAALKEVVAGIDDGQSAVVVTHGGVIWAIVSHALGLTGGTLKMIPSHNTALTRIRVEGDGTMQVAVFNDATHLEELPTQFGPDGATVSLYRHGQTEANVEGKWQGRTDSPLTAIGRQQVKAASVVAPRMEALFTSPLGRTVETASIIGGALGVAPTNAEGLIEMSFGSWENMTTDQAVLHNPELFDQIYGKGLDMPRGGDGESFTQTGERVHGTIQSLVDSNDHVHIGAVSNGAALRSYLTRVVGLTFAERDRFPIPRNSSMSQVRYTALGPVLAAYNVAPHLDV